MSFTEEEIRRAAELKQWAEERIAELEAEIDKLRETLFVVNSVLRRTSFRSAAEIPAPPSERAAPPPRLEAQAVAAEFREVRPIKRSSDGRLFANAYISDDEIAIVPASDVRLVSSTSPFKPFFVSRILEGMKNKDQDAVNRGVLRPEQVIEYEVAEEGGVITKIVVRNYRDKGRLGEIVNSVAWTFTRMLEKKA